MRVGSRLRLAPKNCLLPQAPHRAAAGAACQVRHIEVRILSRGLIGFEPLLASEFLGIRFGPQEGVAPWQPRSVFD
jgi:hypothetical protein